MPAATVSSLTVYPVKSLRGMSVTEAVVEPRGFRGDRRFMVTSPDGRFLSQRECRAMARVSAELDGGILVLSVPTQDKLQLPVSAVGREPTKVGVWQSTVDALRVGPEADAWLSEALGRPAVLVEMPEGSRRPVDPHFDRGDDIVSFADGFPYLVIGDSSLEDLNTRLADDPVPMSRFRPNITVAGTAAYAEDGWNRFRIAQAAFEAVKPCARCVMTTIDPESPLKSREPLATLAQYRNREGSVLFGMNVVPDGPGVVRVGDAVTIDTMGTMGPFDAREAG